MNRMPGVLRLRLQILPVHRTQGDDQSAISRVISPNPNEINANVCLDPALTSTLGRVANLG
jgi:hypothetical protein